MKQFKLYLCSRTTGEPNVWTGERTFCGLKPDHSGGHDYVGTIEFNRRWVKAFFEQANQ